MAGREGRDVSGLGSSLKFRGRHVEKFLLLDVRPSRRRLVDRIRYYVRLTWGVARVRGPHRH